MSVQEPPENKSILVFRLPQKAVDFIMERWQSGCSIVLDLNEYEFEINEVTRNNTAVIEAIEINSLKKEITLSRLNSLKNRLLQAHRNLEKLEEKKAMYSVLSVPLDLINEIEKQQEEISKLREELGLNDN